MEEVLDLYTLKYDADYPLVCFDEGSKQLISETTTPIQAKPGQKERFDYQYQREGVCNMFMFYVGVAARRRSPRRVGYL